MHVADPFLLASADVGRIGAIPGVRLICEAYTLPHAEHVAREHAPDAARTETLTDAQRSAFAAAEALVTLHAPLDLASVAPRLRWLQATGSGIRHLLASGIATMPLALTNAAGAGATGVAEWVVARILEDAKRLPLHAEMQRDGRWEHALGRSLRGLTVGIVGFGAIGQETARLLRPFGVRLVAVRRSAPDATLAAAADLFVTPAQLAEVLPDCDVVVLAVPGNAATEDLVDRAFLAAMPSGSLLVNVARGTVVDENALIDALRTGHLRAAALDVTRKEPLPADDPLRAAPNVRISPHSALAGDGYWDAVLDLVCDNVVRFRDGRPLRNLVRLADL